MSVVLLAHNKADYTARCLAGLQATRYRPFELVIVDNGSTDGTPGVIDEYCGRLEGAGIRTLRMKFDANVGAVAGRNQAMNRAGGEFIVFIDNDVVPRTLSWMGRLAGFLSRNPDVGAVGPKLVYPSDPLTIQCAGCDVSADGRVWFRGRGESADAAAFAGERNCQALISACWMMPASAVRVVGPLDEGFSPVQFEDIDYCYRLREAGYRVVYLPEVEMYHFENVTSDGTQSLNYRYLTVKNGLRFKNKWRRRYSQEGGPEGDPLAWEREVPTARLEDIGELATVP